MISSMTGYGRGEITKGKITAVAELSSVNNRYFELSARLPRSMTLREGEVKEIVRKRFSRGKVNVSLSVSQDNAKEVPVKINSAAAKSYFSILKELRKSLKLKEKITISHLLQFEDIIEVSEFAKGDDKEWEIVKEALHLALEEATKMRKLEGSELMKDLKIRIRKIEAELAAIEKLANEWLPVARKNLEQRVMELSIEPSVIDARRLETEFALLVDKIDITEEIVRFRSHNKFFMSTLDSDDAVGRKLNFLVQEMNREANTIGSKADNSEIAHRVVGIKEELEKIREQLQNIE